MYPADQYLAALVAGMFLAGVVLFFRWLRQRSKTRQQWSQTTRR